MDPRGDACCREPATDPGGRARLTVGWLMERGSSFETRPSLGGLCLSQKESRLLVGVVRFVALRVFVIRVDRHP